MSTGAVNEAERVTHSAPLVRVLSTPDCSGFDEAAREGRLVEQRGTAKPRAAGERVPRLAIVRATFDNPVAPGYYR